MPQSPIIVIGMHRSGTTMLIKLLEELGLFVGDKKRKNYEAVFFQELNRWMLAQANTSWDFPLNYRFTDAYFHEQVKRVSLQHFKGLKRSKYVGSTKLLRYSSLQSIDFAWGWKDPINTITLDTWLDIFPDARIIHIHRNPIDVAASLQKREQQWQSRFELNSKTRLKERALSRKWLYNQSFRVLDLREGVKLWEEYIQLAQAHIQKRPTQSLTIRFESFLDDPLSHLQTLNDFTGLAADTHIVRKAADRIDSGRKFAFVESDELVTIYNEVKQTELMAQLGYADVI